ncbi:hypothetical protein D3C74_250190 [compost metagenome]
MDFDLLQVTLFIRKDLLHFRKKGDLLQYLFCTCHRHGIYDKVALVVFYVSGLLGFLQVILQCELAAGGGFAKRADDGGSSGKLRGGRCGFLQRGFLESQFGDRGRIGLFFEFDKVGDEVVLLKLSLQFGVDFGFSHMRRGRFQAGFSRNSTAVGRGYGNEGQR